MADQHVIALNWLSSFDTFFRLRFIVKFKHAIWKMLNNDMSVDEEVDLVIANTSTEKLI